MNDRLMCHPALSRTCFWLRIFAADHGLMHIFVTDRNARRIAPFITKPWTKTLLANTAELTVLMREGRNCAGYAEHAFICAIYPESLTLCGLDAQTSSLWDAINFCRLRKLVFSKIHWLSYAMIHLIDSCSNTLATLEVSTNNTYVESHLPAGSTLPSSPALSDFRLTIGTAKRMSAVCMQQLAHLARPSPLASLTVEGLRYDLLHSLIVSCGATLRNLTMDQWYFTLTHRAPLLRTLHATSLKHEDSSMTLVPLGLKYLTTRLQQSPFDDGSEICELLESHNFGPSLTHITLQAHHTQSRNADAVKWQRVRRQPLRRAVLARLLLSCRMRGMTLRYDSGSDPIDYADDYDPYSDKSSYLIDDVSSFSTF